MSACLGHWICFSARPVTPWLSTEASIDRTLNIYTYKMLNLEIKIIQNNLKVRIKVVVVGEGEK